MPVAILYSLMKPSKIHVVSDLILLKADLR